MIGFGGFPTTICSEARDFSIIVSDIYRPIQSLAYDKKFLSNVRHGRERNDLKGMSIIV